MPEQRMHRGEHVRIEPMGPDPAGHPDCPVCGQAMVMMQPDPMEPGHLLGSCERRACRCWAVFTLANGRWHEVRRISAEERRNPTWPQARPSTVETARRRARPA